MLSVKHAGILSGGVLSHRLVLPPRMHDTKGTGTVNFTDFEVPD